METTHKYRIRTTSTATRSGVAVADGIEPSISFSAPPEFQGQAGQWTPEHLLVAAVASCFVSTFSGMASNSNFEFLSFELETEGVLGKDKEGWRFQEIVLRPRLSIASGDQSERGLRLLRKAEKSCLIARSLACPVLLESALVIEEPVVVG